VPLPEHWKGAFYGPETMGDALVDWEPEQFIAHLREYPDDPVFLIIGAYFDLKRNDMPERADRLVAAAEVAWPFPWDTVRGWADEALQMITAAQTKSPDVLRIFAPRIGPYLQTVLADRLRQLRQLMAASR